MKNDELKELQKVELNILKDIIKVCDKLKINYFLTAGTLLGAVRHKGFIPWDDDIDICMLREDYNIFVNNAQKYLDKRYFLQTYNTDTEYPGCFAKIRDNNTTFIEKSVANKNINHGIFIDIFPLDYYHKHNKIKERLIYNAIYYDILINSKSFKTRMITKLAKLIYGNTKTQKLCKKLEKLYISNRKNNKVTNYCGGWGIKKETQNIEDFKDFILMDFDGIKAKVPVGYDRILTNLYGDYMKLPPKEKQVTHHYTDIIDTKKSYKKYLKTGE